MTSIYGLVVFFKNILSRTTFILFGLVLIHMVKGHMLLRMMVA